MQDHILDFNAYRFVSNLQFDSWDAPFKSLFSRPIYLHHLLWLTLPTPPASCQKVLPESHLCIRAHICPLLIQNFLPSFPSPALLFLPFTGYFFIQKFFQRKLCIEADDKLFIGMKGGRSGCNEPEITQGRGHSGEDLGWWVLELEGIHIFRLYWFYQGMSW